jgi:hypothetical protein
LIGALGCYALWLAGCVSGASSGYRIEFGSRKKAAKALSIISLARWRLMENVATILSRRQIHDAQKLLSSMALVAEI